MSFGIGAPLLRSLSFLSTTPQVNFKIEALEQFLFNMSLLENIRLGKLDSRRGSSCGGGKSRDHLLLRGVRSVETDIGPDGVVEQIDVLKDHGDMVLQDGKADILQNRPCVVSEVHMAELDIEPLQRACQCQQA